MRAGRASVLLQLAVALLTLAQAPLLLVLPLATLGVFARVHALDAAAALLSRPGHPPRRVPGERRRLALVAAAAFGSMALVAAAIAEATARLAAPHPLGIAAFGVGTLGVASAGTNARRWSEARPRARAFLDSLPPAARARYRGGVAGLWAAWAGLGAGYAFFYDGILLALALLALPLAVGPRRLRSLLGEKDRAALAAAARAERPLRRLNLVVLGFTGLFLAVQWPFARLAVEDVAVLAGAGVTAALALHELRAPERPRLSPLAFVAHHLALAAWQAAGLGDTPFSRGVGEAVPVLAGAYPRDVGAFLSLALVGGIAMQSLEYHDQHARAAMDAGAARRATRRAAAALRLSAVLLFGAAALVLRPGLVLSLGDAWGNLVALALAGAVGGHVLWSIGRDARHEAALLRP